MSPISSTTPNPYESDSEDDDYVPPREEEESESSASDSENGAEKTEVAEPQQELTEEEKKKARDTLWASFQASLAEPTPRPSSVDSKPRMVKIERRYRFAGDETVEVIEVPEDSPEVSKWPRWTDPNAPAVEPSPEDANSSAEPPSELAASSSAAVQPLGGSTKPIRRPGPRKPKTTLSAIPGPSKAKKLTTLDKSALDWQSHVQSQQDSGSTLKDELEANRRAGGYLEKVEFLKRVEERKEDTLDTLKSNKRRRL